MVWWPTRADRATASFAARRAAPRGRIDGVDVGRVGAGRVGAGCAGAGCAGAGRVAPDRLGGTARALSVVVIVSVIVSVVSEGFGRSVAVGVRRGVARFSRGPRRRG
ncbi:hypothetical protein NS359_01305 [Curtobacterium oceanosedimentum]|uniref:Uncharacterized protein n=1 Tax=Curtobacterium oceanosedimentum TaxID=465820 RepID=A0A147DUA0_9MICO|nr:hypothetical protein NS359_01305 [Curtobacterium oceanosedimentum]